MSNSTKLNYLFISYYLLKWPLDQLLGLNYIAEVHIPEVIFFLAFFQSMGDSLYKKTLMSGPMLIWGMWCLYSVLNWYYIGFDIERMKIYDAVWSFMRPYFLLSAICYETTKDAKRTIRWMIGTFCVYVFMGLTMQGNEMRDDASWEGRHGIVLGNHLPLTCVCAIAISIVAQVKGFVSKKALYIITGICVFTIFWVATRKAMAAVFILGAFYALTKVDIHNPRTIFKLLMGVLIMYVVYNLVMEYTLVGQRTRSLEEQEYADIYNVPEWMSFLGDRAVHYLLGWELFLEHPINGIGLNNFMPMTNFPVPFHTEYMVQICEGGIIGFVLYMIYMKGYLGICRDVFKNTSESEALALYGGLVAIMFISLTAWIYDQPHYYAFYGVLCSYCLKGQKSGRKLEKKSTD